MNAWLISLGTVAVCALILAALIGARIIYDRRNQK